MKKNICTIIISLCLLILSSCSINNDYATKNDIIKLSDRINYLERTLTKQIEEIDNFTISLKDDLTSDIDGNEYDIDDLENKLNELIKGINTLEKRLRVGYYN